MTIKKDIAVLVVTCLLIGGLGLVSLKSLAAGETCTTSDGQTYTIPDNKQVVLIPLKWNPKHLSYCIHGKVMKPPVEVVEPPKPPVNKCEGKLVISPSYCDPETGEVF